MILSLSLIFISSSISKLQVESRLTTATLSLKQSEKLMLNGVQGKQGLITDTTPLICAQSPLPASSSGGKSTVVSLWETSSSSGYR